MSDEQVRSCLATGITLGKALPRIVLEKISKMNTRWLPTPTLPGRRAMEEQNRPAVPYTALIGVFLRACVGGSKFHVVQEHVSDIQNLSPAKVMRITGIYILVEVAHQ